MKIVFNPLINFVDSTLIAFLNSSILASSVWSWGKPPHPMLQTSLVSIDSGSKNPYKLVYRVLKFAKDHTNPIRCSAFMYCEDELPSRLDVGKEKYGGSFTTE